VIAGCSDGTIYQFNTDNKEIIKSKDDYNFEIVDIRWNLGEDLFVVVY
jgi:hypothetical protein